MDVEPAQRHPLGDYLRTRREALDPALVGLRTVGPRRTPGLRREELAALSGISVEYLIRLERGRDRRPSPPVVAALADALRLDDAERAHLAALADVRDEPNYDDDVPSPQMVALMSTWPQPTIVMNRFMDLLAINSAAQSLHAAIGLRVGDNMCRALFLDPRAVRLYLDFEEIAAESVANLRALTGAAVDHPRLRELVGELSVRSPLFATLWARGDVAAKTDGIKRMMLPEVGELHLRWDSLEVAASAGQMVVAYQAVGERSAARLRQLDSLGSTGREGRADLSSGTG